MEMYITALPRTVVWFILALQVQYCHLEMALFSLRYFMRKTYCLCACLYACVWCMCVWRREGGGSGYIWYLGNPRLIHLTGISSAWNIILWSVVPKGHCLSDIVLVAVVPLEFISVDWTIINFFSSFFYQKFLFFFCFFLILASNLETCPSVITGLCERLTVFLLPVWFYLSGSSWNSYLLCSSSLHIFL